MNEVTQIATGGDDVAKVLEAEIGKRISEAVTNRLSAEYLGWWMNEVTQIATGGDDVAKVLEAEIGKRISEAVTNRLSAEYLG